ncbi:MAG: tyrosine-type recombinase/integrase [Amylibacter sp.]|nr:tyrosine-type recombinase/integrase [Amylibacter sp.]
MSYENKHTLRDGRIFLYTRNERPTYHVRLKIEGNKNYIVKSTKRRTLAEAVRVAEDLYDDLRYKVRHGLEIKPHSFNSLWLRWKAANQNLLSTHRMKYFSGTAERYFLPYFGDKYLEEISHTMIEGYWTWRINYWSSDEGISKIDNAKKSRKTRRKPYKQKLGNVAKIPAPKSLQMEQSALRQIFSWAYRNGIIQQIPEIKSPKTKKPGEVSRRPAFELHEWRQLYQYLRTWANETQQQDKTKRPHRLHLWQRRMLHNYILFMGTSGLRPNEARQLRWQDVGTIVDKNNVDQVILYISPTTKTGQRECIPLRSAKRYLDRIKTISEFQQPSDLVFCDHNGNPVENYGKTFKKVLKNSGLLEDRFGKARTIYSLRHTYATFRLLYGHANIEDLAQNMGTSPTQIYNHYRHITIRQKASEMGGKLHSDLSTKGLFF